MKVKSSNRLLEGGNLFVCHKLYGEKYCIIGENSIQLEMNLKNTSRDKVLARYSKILGVLPNRIIGVPNLTFHIDVQMCYAAPGLFLIHSMQELLKNFPETCGEIIPENLVMEYDAQVDVISNILLKNGFICEKICGHIYMNEKSLCHAEIFNLKKIKSTIINIASDGKRRHFVLANTHVEEHKEYLNNKIKEICTRHNLPPISLHYLNINEAEFNQALALSGGYATSYARATQFFMRTNNGGLRCQTNFLLSNA